MDREDRGQFNYPVSTRLIKQFNEITVGMKKQEVVAALVEAFVKDPSIAGLNAPGSRPDTDDVGLIGGVWSLDYAAIVSALIKAENVAIHMHDLPALWHAQGGAMALEQRVRNPTKNTHILIPPNPSEYFTPIVETLRRSIERSITSGIAGQFHLAQCRDDQVNLMPIHIMVDNTLYLGGRFLTGSTSWSSYFTIWRGVANSEYQNSTDEFYHVSRNALWRITNDTVAKLP